MPKRMKICFITGTRADYGIIKPVMEKVLESKKLKLEIIVTGMHLQKKYGNTYKEIIKDGFKFNKVKITTDAKDKSEMAKNVGRAIIKFSDIFEKIKSDLVVVIGDRGEMLAGVISANYLGITTAHIHGGELSGHVDDNIRHAITKLSSLHFAATKKARERIIKMGEDHSRVIQSGAPGLDSILNDITPSRKYLTDRFKIDSSKRLVILIMHPVLSEQDLAGKYFKIIIDSILSFINKIQLIIIYPNSDSGSDKIINEIEKYRNHQGVDIYKSLPHDEYLGLLKLASLLIGNSSSGIIEAASFHLPVINIGSRQSNRECGINVIQADYDKSEITTAINKVLSYDKLFIDKINKMTNPYGNGDASKKIVDTIEKLDLNKLKNKRMTY